MPHGNVACCFTFHRHTAGLFLEKAREPEDFILAVGPTILAGCGLGWPALIWLFTLQSTFSKAFLISPKVNNHLNDDRKKLMLNDSSIEKVSTIG